jgi:dTDP-4-dehydrorhamnose 3,5-epimerase
MKPGWETMNITSFEDARGSLKKVFQQNRLEGDYVREVYLLYTRRGGVRGNHYHRVTLEYFTVVSGRARVFLQDLPGGPVRQYTVDGADNQVIKVPPGVAHAFRNDGEEPLVLLALSTREYDPKDPDTFPAALA